MCGGSSGEGTVSICIIRKLLKKPFHKRNFEEKLAIIEGGRPTPNLPQLKSESTGKKKFTRKFHVGYYTRHNFLTGCVSLNKLFCWPCLLFDTTHTSTWNYHGYSDLNNIHNAIKNHTCPQLLTLCPHLGYVVQLKTFGKDTLPDHVNEATRQAKIQHNIQVRKNREVLKKLVDAVLFLANQELAFRGHDETESSLNQGNYLETLKLIAKYDAELNEHLNSNKVFKGTSSHIQNDIIAAVANVLLKAMDSELRESTFISLLLDEATDVSKHSQLSTVLRYCSNGKVRERFRGFTDVSKDRSAKAIFVHVEKTVDTCEIGDKLVAQGYDGAAVMSGETGGLQTLVRLKYEYALYIHCIAHRLNLVLSQVSKTIPDCANFFETLSGFAAFFSHSTKRNEFLLDIVQRRFPQICPTRWCFKSQLNDTVKNARDPLTKLFKEIFTNKHPNGSEWSASDKVMAKGFHTYLKEFKFNFLLETFNVLFTQTDTLYAFLQKKGLDISQCIEKLDETIKFIQKSREEGFEFRYKEALKVAGDAKTRRIQDPVQHYRALYNEIHDVILMNLKEKFQNLENLVFLSLLDHKNFSSYNIITGKFPEAAANSLKTSYGKFFNHQQLKSELATVYSCPVFQKLSVEKIYNLLCTTLDGTFTEVKKLCELILTLPSTTVSVERTFSALKRILTYLRNTMGQERLSNLALLAIERELLHEIKSQPEFYDLVIEEFITTNRRMEFKYRK